MNTYKLVRDIPVEEGYDVVLAGGGPAGSATAICASRLGARALLIEATGYLGAYLPQETLSGSVTRS